MEGTEVFEGRIAAPLRQSFESRLNGTRICGCGIRFSIMKCQMRSDGPA
jgi:hypothetical protein